ncbi:MAG: proline--tRNA ligase [bacterium]|nr:proline--tRNA ligase [bacterium]MDY4108099.1 proline--tRNA ligase [Bacilli bacterium]
MKLKNNYFYTIREDIKDEEAISGKLLVRSGMIKKSSAGVYMYLPIGYKVLKNIESIIREELNKEGLLELSMPTLIPREIYAQTGRTDSFGSSVFSLKDRFNRDYILGPTHEELFTIASLSCIKSYKDMPYSLYQFQTKFRDEPRPRYGLIRVREFVMKDAYSFDKDLDGLDKSYEKIFNAYKRIFDRIGINYKIVRADTGVMGGLLSEEFQALTEIGEDTLVLCDKCDFASNIEVTKHIVNENSNKEEKNIELIETKSKETIEDVCNFLNIDIRDSVKALLMNVDGSLVIFFVRGDRELNEVKALKALNAKEISFANDELIATSNAVPGYTGPVGLNAKVVIDEEVLKMKNFCCGANKEGYHYINANVKDINYDIVADIVNVKEGDICPNCGGKLYFKKGIEIGNTFKLGTKYSEALGLNYSDEFNKLKPVVMGSYGIGLGRCMAAVVEQHNDDKGIIWPDTIAPFKTSIVIVNTKDEIQNTVANDLYDELMKKNVDTILDDRNERLGVKLNDMDLIGVPYRIVVGKRASEGIVELKRRDNDEILEINVSKILEYIK